MIWLALELNENYSMDLAMFFKVRDFKDGIDFFEFTAQLDKYEGDHNPKFEIRWEILNYTILDFSIYNKNHVPEKEIDERSGDPLPF